MNLTLASCLLLLALAYVRGASGAEIFLPDATAKTVGDVIRRELILKITNNFNTTLQAQMDMAHECETKINASVDACQTCIDNTPGQSGSAPDIGTIIKVAVLNPIGTEMENFFKDIASDLKLGKLKDVMGDKFGEFGSILENIANSAGDFFKDTAISAVGHAKIFFENVGSTFSSLGGSIKSVVTAINFKTLGSDILSGLENFGKTIGKGLSSAVTSIGDGFKKIGTSIVDFFSGRRKRAAVLGRFRRATACPMCDKINPELKTEVQIIAAVCGPTFQADLNALSAKAKAMTATYTWAKDITIAKHVQIAYDSASVGAPVFTDTHLSLPVTPFKILYNGKSYTSTGTLDLANAAAVAPSVAISIYNRDIGA